MAPFPVVMAEGLLANLVVEPREFTLPGGRSATSLSDLEWAGWGEPQARATGVWWRGDSPRWVEVVADRQRPLAEGLGASSRLLYTRVSITLTDGSDQTVRFCLPGSRLVVAA